ncbi:hypothetical protein [Nocardia farcinica]|uniref:Uncharacterized protein n=1 Tax=Nocardia farcinica TaxID=37329 RepID=A0A0H5NMT5_NOCFR|nr:hypothetical protein [Nocardia farcinica]AXK85236.1 hypothetical protein DXT66_05940 [Nocardia farcinica]MBF6250015.1 hypothetical protein [Nocardia farcinica]PFX05177.1 hypothetical protein CJ469_00587 [Nocardia farcinica]PFX10447.1 hypothetical protein CJ468_00113 [Nocardia farcinica]CRY76517.1 Uncharacterised protein [Nocardia farcinica]
MTAGRLGPLVHGLRRLRRAPDLAALRAAATPAELAARALIPAGRNLGLAVGLLPAGQRAEATAALLACRVLDAYEDLMDRPHAGAAVLAAAGYLGGRTDTAPPPLRAVADRDSEAVDLVLAERAPDIRLLVGALPAPGRARVAALLDDVAAVMARNLATPLPRTAYGAGVLGRVIHHACELVAGAAYADDELRELAECVGITAQLANDLRDGELALYGAADRADLTRTVLLRVLSPALGSLALLGTLGPRTPGLSARAGMAYLAITTTAFLCSAAGAAPPYPRRLRLPAAVLAAAAPGYWDRMQNRMLGSVDRAIHLVLDAAPELTEPAGDAPPMLAALDHRPTAHTLGPLVVGTAFALVEALPPDRLTGGVPAAQARRMMIADHLAFGALERIAPGDVEAMRQLAVRFQLAAQHTGGGST